MVIEFLTLPLIFLSVHYLLLFFSVTFPCKPSLTRKKPGFSVIIANADDDRILRKTLSKIRGANYPQKKVEIIVVDSSGQKDVYAAVKEWNGKLIKDTFSVGKGAALNIGIRKARNEILYFLDSDTFIEKDALKNIAGTISEETPAVQGIFIPQNKAGLQSLMARLEVILSNIYNFWCWKFLKTSVAASRNFAIHGGTLKKIGGFSNVLAEDANLARRLYDKKITVAFNHGMKAKELVPTKLSHMWKQHERWYGGSLREIVAARGSSIITIPFLVTIAFLYGFLTILGLVFIITGSIFALIGISTGFMVVLHQVSRYLTTAEIILSPLIVVLLSIFSLAVLINVLAKMLFGIRIGWYTTPKVIN